MITRMKRLIYPLTILTGLLVLLVTQPLLAQKSNQKGKESAITLEQVAEKCKGQPLDKRLTIKVVRFNVSNSRAQEQGEFGGELATMLTNALQKTNCFRVLETDGNMGDITGDGLDAQLVVTGEVTEFSEKNTTIIGIQKSKVNIGFILKVLNPQTSDILFSESVNGESISSGFSSGVFTTTKLSGAVANASEQAIIKATEILADQKDRIEAPVLQPVKKFNASNCALLKNGKGPKIMILIPETQTTGGVVLDRKLTRKEMEAKERQENREMFKFVVGALSKKGNQQATDDKATKKTVAVEQATAEGVLIDKFIEAGFRIVDPSVYNKLREQNADQADDKAKMAALGLKLGADIIITGIANSEQVASKQEGNFSFRGRVELRALATEDATILASHSENASADDRAESISAQKSLRSASIKMANYMLEQLCARNMTFASTSAASARSSAVSSSAPGANQTEFVISNTNFNKLKLITDLLTKNPKVKAVQKVSLKGTEGVLRVDHLGNADDLIDILGKSPAAKFDVTGMEEGKVNLTMN
jgi:curli biogenesis system outer membrane secretion channel CsgG